MMIRRLTRAAILAATLFAFAWSAQAAATAARPALEPQIVVTTEVITLGDLVEGAGEASSRPVFRAPALGRVGTIQVARIEEAALLAGLPDINTGGMAQIVVSRAARAIPRAELEAVLADALRVRFNLDQPELNLALRARTRAFSSRPMPKATSQGHAS
jgi:flagella basal body P-ring formation protein FlgA